MPSIWRTPEKFYATDNYVPFDPRPFRKEGFYQPKEKPVIHSHVALSSHSDTYQDIR
jgi:hypothetical protein